MSKEKDMKEEKDSKNWTYDGSEDTWETFDRRMLRYMSKKYDTIGEKMWLGNVPDCAALDEFEYTLYCNDVWNAINVNDPTLAWKLWYQNGGFWEVEWQENWLKR